MATASSPLARQPDQLDYASPTQFRFGIKQLPKVEFITINANLPGISATPIDFATPYKPIPIMGETLTYGDLTITFIVDEYLENYQSLHAWMTGYGFPSNREEFRTFRDVTSNTPAKTPATPSVDMLGNATPDKAMYSDAFLMILTNKNNPTTVSINGYPGAQYTHQGWLTEDHRYFLCNDELDEYYDGINTSTYINIYQKIHCHRQYQNNHKPINLLNQLIKM